MGSKPQATAQAETSNAIFGVKKNKILRALATNPDDYTDASPKGSLDAPIIDLIDEINAHHELVTTSSCSGRVSVFVDGPGERTSNEEQESLPESEISGRREALPTTGTGGKGGGRWLFTSHEHGEGAEWVGQAAEHVAVAFGIKMLNGIEIVDESDESREQALNTAIEADGAHRQGQQLVHFKFEPMILHILTSSLGAAQRLLQAAQQAGFRESGISSALSATPLVAIRTNGLALESIIGIEINSKLVCLVDVLHLRMLFTLAKARFGANKQRIKRLQEQIRAAFTEQSDATKNDAWEDAQTRRERKREEGLAHRARLQEQGSSSRDDQGHDDTDMLDAGLDIP